MESSNVHDFFLFVAIKLTCFPDPGLTCERVKIVKDRLSFAMDQVLASAKMIILRRKLGLSMKISVGLPCPYFHKYFGTAGNSYCFSLPTTRNSVVSRMIEVGLPPYDWIRARGYLGPLPGEYLVFAATREQMSSKNSEIF